MSEGDAEQEFLRQFLAERDAPCPNCQYNLRALTGGVCPECGERIVVRVAMAEPKQAALIAGLIGLSAGAGLNGLLLIYVLVFSFVRGISVGDAYNAFIRINTTGLIVMSVMIYVWLRGGRTIRGMSAGVRWALAAGCSVLSLVDVVVLAIWIR